MSLSSSLSIALSGLTASSRSAEVVSANVANAMTDGYARREVILSSEASGNSGAGVQVDGIQRIVDNRVVADRRNAEANVSNSTAKSDAWLEIEQAIGLPTEAGSLSSHLNALEDALVGAASRPDETVRLDQAVTVAKAVADQFQEISDQIQTLRRDADSDIGKMVEDLNANLQKVETLNWQIFRAGNARQDASGLMDQRQAVVDRISEVVPVTQVDRDGGQIALYTSGGATLIDGPAAEIGFEPFGMITAEKTIQGGHLSGLTINGVALSIGGNFDPIAGGRLSAAFDVRDQIGPDAQTNLDALAAHLVGLFQDPSVDATLASGDAGLFTDGNAAYDAVNETGLASRVRVNAAVDASSGGASWKIRDGLNSVTSGNVGNSELLTALADRLQTQTQIATGPNAGIFGSMSSLTADMLSTTSANRQTAEDQATFHSARVEVLKEQEMAGGVDTDDEVQKLLLIEQVYTANAKVVQTIDELIQTLLEL